MFVVVVFKTAIREMKFVVNPKKITDIKNWTDLKWDQTGSTTFEKKKIIKIGWPIESYEATNIKNKYTRIENFFLLRSRLKWQENVGVYDTKKVW